MEPNATQRTLTRERIMGDVLRSRQDVLEKIRYPRRPFRKQYFQSFPYGRF